MATVKARILDVSYAQGVIDWEKVKPHIDGVIVRCGYGGDRAKQDDSQFKRNADACTRLSIPFGVYLYSYADTVEKAKSEAEHVLRLIRGYKLSYPVYLDLEEYNTRKGAVDRANAFGDIIENAGYLCGVYANLNWWNNYLQGLDRFTKWVAQWGVSECAYQGSGLDMWQYSEKGRISGIKGNVDLNHCYRDFPAEINPAARPKETAKGSFTLEMRVMKFGSKGAAVKALQMLLQGSGFSCGKWGADGDFGNATETALKEYQRQNDLTPDGIAGALTWGSLLGIREVKK